MSDRRPHGATHTSLWFNSKIVPLPDAPPVIVLPKKEPSVPWITPASGLLPSGPVKVCSTDSVPLGLISKIVPRLLPSVAARVP